MPKASEVANELRRFADGLNALPPDTEIVDPWIRCYHSANEKDSFLALAKALPHPFTKTHEGYDDSELLLEYRAPAIRIRAAIPRAAVCTLIEPAKPAVYKCEPLLSDGEEVLLEVES
ncbi:MAG: hypothetical protein ACYCOU_00290 [Sulfobacillus sp.]